MLAMSARQKTDFIVGLFIVVAIAGIVFVALRAANITEVSSSAGYVVRINFDNIGSLIARAPVKSSGVRVGRVRNINYDDEEYYATVDIVIEGQYEFPSDSIFSIVSSNLLGGQYIAIDVGGDENLLKAGDTVEGNSAIVLEELIGKFLFDKAGE